MGLLEGLCAEGRVSELPVLAEGMRLRHFVRLDDPAALAGRGVDLVVLHKDLHSEVRFEPEHERLNLAGCIEALTDLYGPPEYEDGSVAAFTLGSVPAAAAD